MSAKSEQTAEALPMPRMRAAVFLVSAAVIALELALMRALSFRFWHHFAYMVISVALLGFAASGTVLSFAGARVQKAKHAWMFGAILAFALSAAVLVRASAAVPVNVQFLAWSAREGLTTAALEALLVVPFFCGALAIGVALTDSKERIPGHYAANLLGSGVGAIAGLTAMWRLQTGDLFAAVSLTGCVSAAILVRWRRKAFAIAAGALLAAVAAASFFLRTEPAASEYKMISYLENMPSTKTVYSADGPLGRIDAVEGPAIHHAPGLSLNYTGAVPRHRLLLSDGDVLSAVYEAVSAQDYQFLDYTTAALAYHVRPADSVCIIGAGGGGDIGLALLNGSNEVEALEMNPLVITAMTEALSESGGGIYKAPGVQVRKAEARGYLSRSERSYDLVQIPFFGAFAGASAGVYSANENYLNTVESFASILKRLGESGILAVTSWTQNPPREALRVFDTMAEALRTRGLEPAGRLVMIRSWAAVTTLVSPSAFTESEREAVRKFCAERGFDLCWLAGLEVEETNRFHLLERPMYFEAASALLGENRGEFLAGYPFRVAAATDDRPYFSHFFTLSSLEFLQSELGRRSRAYVETGYILLLAAFVQTLAIGAVLVAAPLVLRARGLRSARGKPAVLLYFALLGGGFMVVEMVFLQRLILYLSHPVYSGAAVISGFLVFAGAGSFAAPRWRATAEKAAPIAAAAVVVLLVAQFVLLDKWLSAAWNWPTPLRFGAALAAIAPLAFAMGHMFPLALSRVTAVSGALVPLAWGINGFASVAATVAAPLAALHFGFTHLALAAAVCYMLAGLLFRALPGAPASD